MGHALELGEPALDLGLRQSVQPLGSERLDVERGEHGAVDDRAADDVVRVRAAVRGEIAEEAARERVPGAGRVDRQLEWVAGNREEALLRQQCGAVLPLLGDDDARAESPY